MFLKTLNLTNFKNYEEVHIDFSKKINCFVGDNGVGKTNILDAIHYLSLTKSFFNSFDALSVKHGEEYFIIDSIFDVNEEDVGIYCSFQRNRQKVIKRNGKEYKRFSEHVGRFPVVMISPADSALITDGSEIRRKFINKIVSQYDPSYLDSVIKYNKALQQRNKLLKSFHNGIPFDIDLLKIWDVQLCRYGSYIYKVRQSLVDNLIPVFKKDYSIISSGNEEVTLGYLSHLSSGNFENILADALEKDRFLEYTSVGIHKDDLILEMNGYPVKSTGSQGQQKTFLSALKLSNFEYLRQMCGITPILLLDDIFDKFDKNRVAQILKLIIDDNFGQVFITDTQQERLLEILETHNVDCKLFKIDKNRVEELFSKEKR